jgi:hypothetical protein
MRLLIAIAWLGVGALGLWSLHHRWYVAGLPSTRGNRELRRRYYWYLLLSLVSLAIGLLNVYLALR